MSSKYIHTLYPLLLSVILLGACTPVSSTPESLTTATFTNTPSRNATGTKPAPTETPSPTTTQPPTITPTQMVAADRIPIIEYHNPTFALNDEVMMTPEWFDDQLRWLSENGYTTLNSAQLVDFMNGGSYPQKSVVLSFDIGVDRHSEYAQIVIPALRKYGFTAIIFLVSNTNLIGDDCDIGELFCWSELKSWADEGLISVESHGIWHMDYTTLDTTTQKTDAGLSKELIEANIGQPVLGFAYPFDSYNSKSFDLLKSLGYQFAVAGFTRSDRSVLKGDQDRYSLPRIYPYSNPDMYPRLSTGNGLTFEEMIEEQTSLINLADKEPTLQDSTNQKSTQIAQSSSLTATSTPTSSFIVVSSATEYISKCNFIDKTADQVLRVYQLNHLIFQIDISPEVQASLPTPVKLVPSCNIRPDNNPRAIVIHGTRGPLTGAITTFQKLNSTSAHYIIDRDGTVIQLVPESLGAYHVTCSATRSICQASCPICDDPEGKFVEPATQSIGIELVNAGTVTNPDTFDGPIYEDFSMAFGYRYWDDYPEAQIKSLVLLINDIRKRWDIPLDMVIGHYRINTNTDPGPALNLFWDRYGNPPRPAIFPPD